MVGRQRCGVWFSVRYGSHHHTAYGVIGVEDDWSWPGTRTDSDTVELNFELDVKLLSQNLGAASEIL